MNNFNEFLTDVVKVERPQQPTKSASGQPINIPPLKIYDELKCSIQPYKNWTAMSGAGQTFIDMKVIYCDLVDVKINDIITDFSGNKYKVTQVNVFNDIISHLKLVVTGGVI